MGFWSKVRKLEKFKELLEDVVEEGKDRVIDVEVKIDNLQYEKTRVQNAISFANTILSQYEKRD